MLNIKDSLCINGYVTGYRLFVNGKSYIKGAESESPEDALLISNGELAISNFGNTVEIGSFNAFYTHFINSKNIPFYFNKSIYTDGGVFPYMDSTYSLGTSTLKWNSVYATTFIGNLTGSADMLDGLHVGSGVWSTAFIPKVKTDGIMEIGKTLHFNCVNTGDNSNTYTTISSSKLGLIISGITLGTFEGSLTGNAVSANLLNWINKPSTATTSFSTWRNGVTDGEVVWGQNWRDTSLSTDTGDLTLWLKKDSDTSSSINMTLDGSVTACQGFIGNGTSCFNGTVIVNPGNNNDWTEGIRILNSNYGWTTLLLGGSSTSSRSTETWSLHTHSENFYLTHNGSETSADKTGILCSDPSGNWLIENTLGINGKNTHYQLYVNGATLMTGDLNFSFQETSNWVGSANGISWAGGSDGARIYYDSPQSDCGQLHINLIDDSNVEFRIDWNGTNYNRFLPNSTFLGGNLYVSNHIRSCSSSSSWLEGLKNESAALNIVDATNTYAYWPWVRQTNTASGEHFSIGILNSTFYILGSSVSRTENGFDTGVSFNISNGRFIVPDLTVERTTTFGGSVQFANYTANKVGDDVAIGDCNIGGTLGVMGVNGASAIRLLPSQGTWGKTAGPTWSRIDADRSSISGILYGTFNSGVTTHYSGDFGGSGNAADWILLGYLNTGDADRSTIIDVYSGAGYNGISTQNTHIQIFIKKGWQLTPSASSSFGLSYLVSHAESNQSQIQVRGITTSPTRLAVWVYLPWAYWNGHYNVTGRYSSWEHSGAHQTSTPGGTLQDSRLGTVYGSKIYGAVWNDYAEYRQTKDTTTPGHAVYENGDGTLSKTFKRLQPGVSIISDTFGFAIGKTKKATTPIAVAGRVLVFPYEDKESYSAGDAVCSGPNGTVSKMTREEIKEWPDRIIGIVSEIPDYKEWGSENVKVNGRIWIKVS